LRPAGFYDKDVINMSKTLIIFHAAIAAWLVVFSGPAPAADRVYQAPADFVAEVFPLRQPAKTLWLSKEAQAEITRILGHKPQQLRQRYWSEGGKTLWVLEEIGKEDVITAGFVVKDGKIEQTRVLVYRESRGMEVRYPAFVNQFRGAALAPGNTLDRNIDAISGATLSVHAMVRMARVALYFDQLAR
jgi:hypothetical protein